MPDAEPRLIVATSLNIDFNDTDDREDTGVQNSTGTVCSASNMMGAT